MSDRRVYALCIMLALLLASTVGLYSADALAQTTSPRDELLYTGTDPNESFFCPNYDGVLIERIVNCLVGIDIPNGGGRDGVFTMVVRRFLATQNTYMDTIAAAMITLVIALHGAKVALGVGGVPGLQKDTAILLLKIGGVYFFLDNAADIYNDIMAMIFDLLGVVSRSAGATLCPGTTTQANLWQQFDCLLDRLIGYSGGATIIGGFLGMVVAWFFSGPIGVGMFFAVVAFVMLAIFSTIRAVNIYVMAMIGLSFMFLLSPIFVPMILFRSTYNYFHKWLMVILSYAMMPVIMFAFMWMAVMAIDVSVFSGRYSVYGTLTGGNSNYADPSFRVGGFLQGTYEEPTDVMAQRRDVNPTEGDVTGNRVDTGLTGNNALVRNVRQQEGDQYMQWLDVTAVDGDALAAKAGAANPTNYKRDVFMSFVGAALLLYVIYSMNNHIPGITSHLLVGGSGVGAIARSKVVGQQTIEGGVRAAKTAAIAYATGGTSLKKKALETAAKTLQGNRNKPGGE